MSDLFEKEDTRTSRDTRESVHVESKFGHPLRKARIAELVKSENQCEYPVKECEG